MSELQTATAETTRSAPQDSPRLVLVADADAASRRRRTRQLQQRGLRVAVARTAFEAIVKACCHLPDLIVVDASLGEPGAQETTDLLATCPATAHIPVFRMAPGRRLPVALRGAAAV